MKVLLTGANGYIGTRLLPSLLEDGHTVTVLVRRIVDRDRLQKNAQLNVVQGDLCDLDLSEKLPKDLEAAYYLVHSMSDYNKDFANLEQQCALNFVKQIRHTQIKQVIYLSGLSHDKELSSHLSSRLEVEKILKKSGVPYTILRSGIIIGSGSASFEMIRDLSEKLPVMIAPKWVNNRTQPIAIADVLFYLKAVLGLSEALNKTFEIAGPDLLTYKDMLLGYSKIRGLKRWMMSVPVLTPRLSSYWLYFVTSTNFSLASTLVESLRNESVCHDFNIKKIIPHTCLTFDEAVRRALAKIDQNFIPSGWRDAMVLSRLKPNANEYVHYPVHGCLTDQQIVHTQTSFNQIVNRIWSIGGKKGWYYVNWAWKWRGVIDKFFGGVGLNRSRTHPIEIEAGDVIDFWRVLVADKEKARLLLFAEMKLPGEAWLEFNVTDNGQERVLKQTAIFRPKGVLGRLYWYLLYPIHLLIFKGMAKAITKSP